MAETATALVEEHGLAGFPRGSLEGVLGFASLIVRTVLYFNPLKVFYPTFFVVLLLFCGSLAYDLFLEATRPNLGDKTVLLFVAAVQVLTIGLLADLIEKKSRL